MADNKTSDVSSTAEEFGAVKPVSKFTRWYRSPLFNIVVVGLISFTQPGIWNALNNTGAGGQQSPYLVNGANSLTFGIMVFGCLIFSALANKFGLKSILIIGTLGYAPYSAALYVNNRYGTEWFVLFGGATCGIAASALWASEGAIALGYPETKDRSKFTGLWLGLRELGQLIGASIQLSLNHNQNQRGKVGYSTYLVLIALQCLGLPLALLVSPPEKVIRSDGTRVNDPSKNKAVFAEFKKLWIIIRKKHIALILPVLITFQWNSTYQSIYLTKYFSVRSRTLGALSAGIAATAANIFWGWFLDLKYFSRPKLAKICWYFSCTFMTGLFAWQIANEYLYANTVPKVTLDWESPGFGRAFAVNVLFRFMNESNLGIIRSFESIGSCLAFGIGAVSGISPMTNLIVAFVMFAVAVPFTTMVVYLVPEHPASHEVAFDSLQESNIAAVNRSSSEEEVIHVVPVKRIAAVDSKTA